MWEACEFARSLEMPGGWLGHILGPIRTTIDRLVANARWLMLS